MNILQEAQKIVDRDRQKAYGSPKECLEKTAAIFFLLTGYVLTAKEVAIFNIAQKLARLSVTRKKDTVVDICGYLYILTDKLGGKK